MRIALPRSAWLIAEAPVKQYGLTPLDFLGDVPFASTVIDAHLDDLTARQQPDCGWPISWEAPGEAARATWRGRWTLSAISHLRRYGRV